MNTIPHSKFTFAKIWIMAAQFEIRQKDLKAARQILGSAIGRAAKDKVRFQRTFTCVSRYFMFCVSLISHMKAG